MAGGPGINAYDVSSGATTGSKLITRTQVGSDKQALDVAIKSSGAGSAHLGGLSVLAEQVVTVTTSQTELKGGATREAGRLFITVENRSSNTVYVGITGVGSTKETLFPNEKQVFYIGDQAFYGIVASSTASVVVKEWGPA